MFSFGCVLIYWIECIIEALDIGYCPYFSKVLNFTSLYSEESRAEKKAFNLCFNNSYQDRGFYCFQQFYVKWSLMRQFRLLQILLIERFKYKYNKKPITNAIPFCYVFLQVFALVCNLYLIHAYRFTLHFIMLYIVYKEEIQFLVSSTLSLFLISSFLRFFIRCKV
jgi:hypothetical protein